MILSADLWAWCEDAWDHEKHETAKTRFHEKHEKHEIKPQSHSDTELQRVARRRFAAVPR